MSFREKKVQRVFKKSITAEDAKRNRLESNLKLRENTRMNMLSRRRLNDGEEETQEPITPEMLTPEYISQHVMLLQNPDPEKKLEAATYFRKILSLENHPPLQLVVDSGAVPHLLELLKSNIEKIVFEASWALTNIASGTTQQTKIMVDAGAIPLFCRLLDAESEEIRDQSVWALGNISGDSVAFRDMCLQEGALLKVIQIYMGQTVKKALLRNCAWTVSNLCRLKPQPNFEYIRPAIPPIAVMLRMNDHEINVDACWSVSYILDIPTKTDEALLTDIHNTISQTTIIPDLIRLLSQTNAKLLSPALRAVGNFIAGPDSSIEFAINHGFLTKVQALLRNSTVLIRKETAWVMSNIVASSVTSHTLSFLKAELLPHLFQLALHDDTTVKREVGWCIFNLCSSPKLVSDYAEYFLSLRIIEVIYTLLNLHDEILVENLLAILKLFLQVRTEKVCEIIEGLGLNIFVDLQQAQSERVYHLAREISMVYFSGGAQNDFNDDKSNFTY